MSTYLWRMSMVKVEEEAMLRDVVGDRSGLSG